MTQLSANRVALTLLATLLPLASCMTTAPGTHRDPTLPESTPEETKPGSKQESGAPAPAAPAQAAAAPVHKIEEPAPPSIDEQLAFIRKESAPSAPFTDVERILVAQLPSSPPAGSVAEAALAIGMVRTVLNPLNVEASTFQEADLVKPPAPAVGAPAPAATPTTPKNKLLSLEQLCKERGLNLPDALSENPLLGTGGVAKQVLAALAKGDNSLEFRNEITLSLKKEATIWSEVNGVAAPAPEQTATTPPPPATATATPPAPAADANLPPNPADLAGGDAVLGEAQILADRGNYQAAIEKGGSRSRRQPAAPPGCRKS